MPKFLNLSVTRGELPVETTEDLLNFTVVADTAAQLVRESTDQPLSIGVSGSWGTGKSSLIKMIGASLEKTNGDEGNNYVFLEFDAWLYQGYEAGPRGEFPSVRVRLPLHRPPRVRQR